MDEQNQLPPAPEEEEQPKRGMGRFYRLRILIGAYLIYLGWQLLKNVIRGATAAHTTIPCAIFGGLFVLAGLGLIVWSLWLISKE